MKQTVILFLLLTATFSANCQENTRFNLTDSIVELNLVFFVNQVVWEFGKCSLRSDSYLQLDSIALFLKNHLNVNLQILRNETARPNYSLHSSQCRADEFKNYLVAKGINSSRLVAKGKTVLDDREFNPETASDFVSTTKLILTSKNNQNKK